MDTKTVSIGLIAIAALIISVAKPTTKELVASKTQDESVTQILKTDPILNSRLCYRAPALVDGSKQEKIIWFCNGSGMPKKDQDWLNSIADETVDHVVLEPIQNGSNIDVQVKLYKKEAVEEKTK